MKSPEGENCERSGRTYPQDPLPWACFCHSTNAGISLTIPTGLCGVFPPDCQAPLKAGFEGKDVYKQATQFLQLIGGEAA